MTAARGDWSIHAAGAKKGQSQAVSKMPTRLTPNANQRMFWRTIDTVARRRPDMEPAVILERISALRRLTFPGAHVVSVDAEQPLAEVIRAVKGEVWRLL